MTHEHEYAPLSSRKAKVKAGTSIVTWHCSNTTAAKAIAIMQQQLVSTCKAAAIKAARQLQHKQDSSCRKQKQEKQQQQRKQAQQSRLQATLSVVSLGLARHEQGRRSV